jgi:peptidyl-prolyl cis-trans isomerase SurA
MNITKHNILILLAVLLPMISAAQDNNIIDEVIWVVGDEPILKSEVEEQRLASEINGQPIEGNPRCVIPEQIAIQKLFAHQALIDSIEVKDGDVLQELEYRLNYMIQMAGSKEKLEEYMRKPMTQIRQQTMEQLKNMMVVDEVKRKIAADVKVTPAEVRNHFKNIPKDSLPLIPTRYEVQIITSTPAVSREETQRIEDELREYTRRINSGESDFATLAMMYSDDEASRRNGGELPYMGKGEFVPEFANVAFSLTDPKKVSRIVKTEFGYHIIQLIDRRGDKIRVRHILKKPEISDTAVKNSLARLDSVRAEIDSGRISFDDAVIYSDDKDTRNNRGIMGKPVSPNNPRAGMTQWFELRDMPQDVAKVVSTLKPGEISQPFRLTDAKGRTVCAIVKLRNRNEQHYASITEDFQTLQDLLVTEEQNKVIDNWIREKQKTTYISIKPEWRDCDFHYPGWVKK